MTTATKILAAPPVNTSSLSIADLKSLSTEEIHAVMGLIETLSGCVSVIGPTGTGKTSFLVHVMHDLYRLKAKNTQFLTIESPPEVPIFFATQISVKPPITIESVRQEIETVREIFGLSKRPRLPTWNDALPLIPSADVIMVSSDVPQNYLKTILDYRKPSAQVWIEGTTAHSDSQVIFTLQRDWRANRFSAKLAFRSPVSLSPSC